MSFHSHEHNHSHVHSTNTHILRVSLAVIAGFMLVEAAAGWLSGSYALSAGAAERSTVFRRTRACMFEAAQPQVASPPEKPRAVREVWQSQTCARSHFSFASFSLARQRKGSARAGMRRKDEQDATEKGYLKFHQASETQTQFLLKTILCASSSQKTYLLKAT